MHSLKSVFTSTPSPAQNQKCGVARSRSRRRGRQWCDKQRGGVTPPPEKKPCPSLALLRAAHAPQHCNTSPFQSGPVFSSCPWPCPSPAPPEVASPPGECESVAPDGAACTSSPASRSRPFAVVDSCGAMGWRKASAHSQCEAHTGCDQTQGSQRARCLSSPLPAAVFNTTRASVERADTTVTSSHSSRAQTSLTIGKSSLAHRYMPPSSTFTFR